MKRLGLRLLQKKPVQTSTQTSLVASAAVPDSGFAFVNNSQGASAALNEFTTAISAALDHIDLEDDSEDAPFRAQLRLLDDAVGEYSNSRTDSCRGLTDWNGSKSTAEITAIAFKCAACVYKSDPNSAVVHDSDKPSVALKGTHRKPKTDGVSYKELEFARPSLGGTAKAVGFWIAESEAAPNGHGDPALIIAIRGTAGYIDHMVNVNGRPVPASEFLGASKHPFLQARAASIFAHSGFLNGAKALLPLVLRQVSKANQEERVKNVVFTGHSAGGGVASLLYQKVLLEAASSYPNLKFSCITFGSPPTLSVDITKALRIAPSLKAIRGLNLAFVNEFDMVPRTDQAYVRSLIDLYRSIYYLEPLMTDAIRLNEAEPKNQNAEETVVKYELPPLDFEQIEKEKQSQDPNTDRQWKLPLAEYNIIGDRVLLRKEKDVHARAGEAPSRVLRALSISPQEFEKLLYCGIQTHSRTYYDDRVELMLQGKFNYRERWED